MEGLQPTLLVHGRCHSVSLLLAVGQSVAGNPNQGDHCGRDESNTRREAVHSEGACLALFTINCRMCSFHNLMCFDVSRLS
jgi:hypothetical protein